MLGEGLGERRRGRDRVPRAYRGAAVDSAETRGVVAFQEDAVADGVSFHDAEVERATEFGPGVLAAHVEGLDVGRDQLILALELLRDQLLDDSGVDAKQLRQRADVNDVLE